MNGKHGLNGSTWRRWDLHIHAPGTKLSNAYGDPNEENLKSFVNELEKSKVQAFGVTDYFCFDGYYAVVSAYKEHFPSGEKLFIPNIEFRLTETVSSDGRNVHTHVLIDPEFSTETKLQQLLNDLYTHKTRDDSRLRCSDLSTEQEYVEATVSLQDLKDALRKVFPDETKYLIVTAANNDGLRGVDTKSPRSMSISDELDKASHAFFGSSKNTSHFLDEKRYEDESSAENKPVFSGSDAHSFEELKRLTGDEAGYETTWIKSDLTFRGLRQTLFEPKWRVHIGEKPTVLERQAQDATRFISELNIDQIEGYVGTNGSWFKNVTIPFNPELTAIIGNKGSGKSAIADIIGLLGESRQFEHFSFLTDDTRNRKFRQKGFSENFHGNLRWESGALSTKLLNENVDILKPETVKYLPQNYFENLTNEIEVKAFRNEIEEVVFSHVDESDRMGKSTFEELEELKTAQSKSDISALKARLRELNIEIVDLEDRANPSTIKSLKEQLKQRQDEYNALKKSVPEKVEKPTGESPEQLAVAKEIENNNQILSDITRRGKSAVARLSSLKADTNSLTSLKSSLTTSLCVNLISDNASLS